MHLNYSASIIIHYTRIFNFEKTSFFLYMFFTTKLKQKINFYLIHFYPQIQYFPRLLQ